MGNLRPVLIIGLVFLGYMLWIEWQKAYGPQPTPSQSSHSAVEATSFDETPSIPSPPGSDSADLPLPDETRAVTPQASVQGDGTGQDLPPVGTPTDLATETASTEMRSQSPFVTVKTDVLDIEIDLTG